MMVFAFAAIFISIFRLSPIQVWFQFLVNGFEFPGPSFSPPAC